MHIDQLRGRRGRWGGVTCALVLSGQLFAAAPAGAAPAPTVTGPGATVVAGLDAVTPVPGFAVAGSADDPVFVDVSAGAGDINLPVTAGLTPTGAASGSELTFSGTQADVNAALSALTYTGSTPGTTSVTVALASPGLFSCPSTGHHYQVVAGSYDFDQALAAASETFGGAGYLATVTSADENDCIFAGVGAYTGDGRNAWIGAQLVDGSTRDWEWVSGPEAGTTFWTGGRDGAVAAGQYADWDRVDVQPQNDPGQACAQYYNSGARPTWHDNGCGVGNTFVAESPTPAVAIASATATVRTLPAPPAPDDLSSTGDGTAVQTVTVPVPSEGSVTLLDGDQPASTVTVAGQGSYVLDPATGLIAFTPVLGFAGSPTPVVFRVTDADGQFGDAGYAPAVAAPAPSVATDLEGYSGRTTPPTATLSVPAGGAVTLLDGDRPVATVTVPGQGTHTLDAATGTITFTPIAGFLGRATPVTYRLTDAYGQSASARFTAVVLPAAPDGAALTSTGLGNAAQSVSVVVPVDGTLRLLNAGLVEVVTLTVAGQGTYTADSAAGTLTFVPVDGFVGTTTPVSYHLIDVYGRSAIGTYSATVEAVPTTSTTPTSTADATATVGTTTSAAVAPISTTTASSPPLAYTGLRVTGALAAVLLLVFGGAALVLLARRPRGRAH